MSMFYVGTLFFSTLKGKDTSAVIDVCAAVVWEEDWAGLQRCICEMVLLLWVLNSICICS